MAIRFLLIPFSSFTAQSLIMKNDFQYATRTKTQIAAQAPRPAEGGVG